jgi:hypothetical protein
VDEVDIGSAATVVEIAKSISVGSAQLADALEDPAVKERVKNEVEAAIKKEDSLLPVIAVRFQRFQSLPLRLKHQWRESCGAPNAAFPRRRGCVRETRPMRRPARSNRRRGQWTLRVSCSFPGAALPR